MYEIVNRRDRKILGALGLLLILAIVFLVFVALRQKVTYSRVSIALSRERGTLQSTEDRLNAKQREWRAWEQTQRDVGELREKYFYDDKEGITQLRKDLQMIFNDTRTNVSQVRYNYSQPKNIERVKVVRVTFQTSGTYQDIKKLIHSFEVFPKFLILEKVNFSDVDSFGRGLRLNLSLAGYFYEK
ncbi:MAG: hypothetical protein JXB23_17795 [Candidatus Aminicenantes bacterium]|nr:hypothetical protein [Candidatus Aminicenantes bacterium]